MLAPPGIYENLNERWKLACRILLGKEVGELSSYKNWLSEGLEPMEVRTSTHSGKNVFAVGKYPKDAPFISFEEINYSQEFEPLSINDIKDIDSIKEALGERAVFCGDLVLGKSSNVDS
ncbi:MAG: hypothetical protein WCT31_05015, partial [Candidatus Micrarchaeia archaeon]